MRRAIFIMLLVVFLLFLSNCNNFVDMADLNTPSSTAKNSGTTESAPAESQADLPVDTSTPVSGATVLAPTASGTPAASSDNNGSQVVISNTALSDVPDLPHPTHEVTLPAAIPNYTTEENILSNTLATTYRGEHLRSIYALDVKNHLTARYNIAAAMTSFDERYFAALLENADANPKAADRAFILFTDKERHYIYLNESTPPELNAIWETIYSKDAPKNMHWLTHMTTSKIVKISFNGWNQTFSTYIGLTAEKSEAIAEISDFLKNNLTADASRPIKILDAAVNPTSSVPTYGLRIQFDNGVIYFLTGGGDFDGTDAGGSGIGIYTSDLDKTIFYTLNERVAGQLRDFMEEK